MNIGIKKGLTVAISVALAFTIAPSAIAKKQEDKTLHNQAAELNKQLAQASTIVTKQAMEKAEEEGAIRDGFRNQEVTNKLEQNAEQSELDKVNVQRDLAVSDFILKNVPHHILAAGPKSINAFILDNFVNKDNGSGVSSVKTVWKSTSSAVSVPNSSRNWTPTVKEIEPDEPVVIDDPSTKTHGRLSKEEQEALSQLGLTEKELAEMLGDGEIDVVQQPEPRKAQPPEETPQTNVVINNVDVNRVIIMGRSKFADVEISMQLISGQNKKKISRTFTKIKPGYMFEVEGVRFELVSLTQRQAVFENLETKKTYRKLID